MQEGVHKSENPGRLPLLDALRGIAALAVLLYHANNLFPGLGAFARAYLFVDLFFLLSGFVLTAAIDGKMRAGLRVAQFMRKRWLRLWPMIVIGAFVGAIPFAMVNDDATTSVHLLKAILLIPLLALAINPYPLNPPHWSLAMELIANFLHAAILWRLPTKALYVLVVFLAAILGWQIHVAGVNNFQSDGFSWPLALSRVVFAYVLGMAIARKHSERDVRQPGIGPIMVPLIVIMTLPFVPFHKALVDGAVTLFILPGIFLWATVTPLPQRFVRAADSLGVMSYPLYAVHLPILVMVASWRGDGLGLLLACALSLSLAWILAQMFERSRNRAEAKPSRQHLPT